jgi:hypothetical protein
MHENSLQSDGEIESLFHRSCKYLFYLVSSNILRSVGKCMDKSTHTSIFLSFQYGWYLWYFARIRLVKDIVQPKKKGEVPFEPL